MMSEIRQRSVLEVKLDGLARLLMCQTLSGILPLYIVTEYPKSGGSWVSQMLADYLQIPFPRNQFPRFQSSVMQGHYLYSPMMRNVVVVLRDGRDIMVSSYYHSLFKNERENHRLVTITRSEVQFNTDEDIRVNLPSFIEYKFNSKKHPRFTWPEFVDSWLGKKVIYVKYEDLLQDTNTTLRHLLYDLMGEEPDPERVKTIVNKYSFKNQSGRRSGEENTSSFLRKGIAGDWKNNFTLEAKQVFNHYAGETLVKLGYEIDDSWV